MSAPARSVSRGTRRGQAETMPVSGAVASSPSQAERIGRERVADIQRARIVAATVQVACERGAANVSVSHVVERAGVSRRTFYDLYRDRDGCLLAAFEEAVSQIKTRVAPAFERGGSWQERVRSALVELLAFCESDPLLARALLVESAAGGTAVLACRNELLGQVTAIVDEGRVEADGNARGRVAGEREGLGSLIAEGVVGGVSAVLSARLARAGTPNGNGNTHVDFLSLCGPLMGMIVLPYLGAAAARREASRAAPKRTYSAPVRDGEMVEFHDLGIRLTYRTLRVLTSVAEHPGGSNRVVGQSAGMSDQGQISKLLSRLQRVGLVQNSGGVVKGEPNSWVLTDRGLQIVTRLRICAGNDG